MISINAFFSRRTLVLFVGVIVLLALGVVLWWKAQIDRTTIAATKSEQATLPTKQVITNLPLNDLLNEQVVGLRQRKLTTYAAQGAQVVDSYPQPSLPSSIDIANTGIGNGVLITWHAASYQSYDGVVIDRSTGIEQSETEIATIPDLNGSYLDTTVNNSETYYYRVRSYRKSETTLTYSEPSTVITITVQDVIAPGAPTNVQVTRAAKDPMILTVTWKNPAETDVVANQIYRSQQAGALGEVVATVQSGTAWQDTVPAAGAYYYTITALDSSGNESSTQLSVAPAGNKTPFVSSSEQAEQLLRAVNP